MQIEIIIFPPNSPSEKQVGGYLNITTKSKKFQTGIFLKIPDELGLYYLQSYRTLSKSTCHFNYTLKSNLTYYFMHLG
jgi:hypothetical protein